MPLFLIMTKLLLFKILWISSVAYEYGYHPSAEEFDSLMRETSRTWTRDLLANERRRALNAPISERRSDNLNSPSINTRDGEYFVPKFKYEKEQSPFDSKLNLKWPGHEEKIWYKPRPTYFDQQSAPSSTSVNVYGSQNIGSTLDFTMFSDKRKKPHSVLSKPIKKNVTTIRHEPQNSFTNGESSFHKWGTKPEVSTTASPFKLKPTKISHGTVIQVNSDSSEYSHIPRWHDKYSINNLYNNNSEAHFPIFFTNPVTGIVYAITEIGKMDESLLKPQRPKNNHTIPIYITKEQYDKDMYKLRKQYENQCASNKKITSVTSDKKKDSVISGSLTTTGRPQIIRLQKPSVSKLPLDKIPIRPNHHEPPSVMVQTEVTVNDQVQQSSINRLNRLKTKKKKKKRPGRKPGIIPQQKPSVSKDTQPQIIIGSRTTTSKPTISRDKLKTQLERPYLPTTTVFSNNPIAATSGYVIPQKKVITPKPNSYLNHRLTKRSLPVSPEITTISPTISNSSRATQTLTNVSLKTKIKVSLRRPPVRKKGQPHPSSNVTKLGTHRPNNVTKIRFVKRKASTTPNPGPNSQLTTLHPSVTRKPGLKSLNRNHTKLNSQKKKERKSTKRGQDDDNGFDIFDLFESSENDDDDDDDDEDEKDAYESEYYYYDEAHKSATKKPKRKNSYHNTSNDTKEDEEDDDDNDNKTFQNLKEQISHDNSSSAEEGADFGALEEFDLPEEEQHEATPELELFSSVGSETKNTDGKKRIRRRPASSDSYEDDNDDTDDDSGGGVGSFFRMMFYPVQVAMGKILDTFGGTNSDTSDEDINDKLIYPTYTQYSSVTNVASNSAETDQSQGNSLTSWLSSLFGFNRRTKKIGSTTAAPLPVTEATEAPGWFESWFGFSGSKASSTETSASYEDYDDYDKWFSSWFSTKPKAKRRTATTSTTTATLPQVPILTIVDPMRNPQNWLGILAHHIINSTKTTTHNPLMEALTRATTTENPDIPQFISYDKYQIWRLKPQDEAQVKALEDYKRTEEGVKLQWLKGPTLRGLTDVLVPPKMIIDFQGTLQFESIAHEILIFDVGKAIAYEQTKEQFYLTTPRPHKHQQKQKYASLINMSWNKYYEYDDIVKYLESVRMRHPQIVELFHIGRSYEGRPLVVVKLEMKNSRSSSNNGDMQHENHKKLRHKKKSGLANAVFIEAGTHGLEWIGPATATWMINELLRVMKSNKTTTDTDFIRNTTWYIMPVLNPDGYVYSHEYDRFWRKSRSRHISRPSGLIDTAMTWLQQKKIAEKVCYGVDLDRNWHYQWGKRGSSKSPCNEYFAGPIAFSEPETKALSEFLMDNRKQIKLYISMQAYGQIISYPTKINVTFDNERLEDFMDVAMAGIDGLRKKGNKSRYKIDSANDLIEHRAGCSDAYAAYEVGIPFSYTLYLADNGVHGYLLPSSSIEPTSRDAFEIIISMLEYI